MSLVTSLPRSAVAALQASVDILARLPEIERAVARASGHVEDVLDEVLERIRPIESELRQVREHTSSLEDELSATRNALEPIEQRLEQLNEVAAQLEGALEHVLGRVPGLSAKDARKRGDEAAAAAR